MTKRFFYACPKWVFFTKIYSKKIRNSSGVNICDIFIYEIKNSLNELLFMKHKLPQISFVHVCVFAPCVVLFVLPSTT
jgi:hypothetical protein